MKNPRIAITCGDPAGVGPETITAWAKAQAGAERGVTVIGPLDWLERNLMGTQVELEPVGSPSFQTVPGQPSVQGARIAFDALEIAARGCVEGRFDAVVTAPISKSWMREAGFLYAGHTEFFADRWQGEPTMGFVGSRLKVVLATWHEPLMRIGSMLQDGRLLARACRRAASLCRSLDIAEPRIAVCGLNPHAGEDGLMGNEERDTLNPALKRIREAEQLPHLSDCLPADTVFWRALQGDFDCVVALYHDQGLGPLKTLDFENAVNITLGLRWIRTSPDHGTAFGIAGQGKASWNSLGQAISLARRLASAQ